MNIQALRKCKIEFMADDGSIVKCDGFVKSFSATCGNIVDVSEFGDSYPQYINRYATGTYNYEVTLSITNQSIEDENGNKKTEKETERLLRKLNV